jgi:drug/metabolite transporter (DMT)-like permease
MKFFLLSLVICGAVCGDLAKAAGMRQLGEVDEFGTSALGQLAKRAAKAPSLWLSVACHAVAFFSLMGLLSIADVSFVVPATAATYAIETLLARFILHEVVTVRRWAGAALVMAGVFLLGG